MQKLSQSTPTIDVFILADFRQDRLHLRYQTNLKMTGAKFETVAEYLATFPASTARMLKEMRKIVKAAAPMAEEVISYNMPAVKLHTPLVYYAGYKAHVGFYPTASGMAQFTKELSSYETSKGAVRFPLDKPLPVALITKMVKFRIQDDIRRAEIKNLAKASKKK